MYINFSVKNKSLIIKIIKTSRNTPKLSKMIFYYKKIKFWLICGSKERFLGKKKRKTVFLFTYSSKWCFRITCQGSNIIFFNVSLIYISFSSVQFIFGDACCLGSMNIQSGGGGSEHFF